MRAKQAEAVVEMLDRYITARLLELHAIDKAAKTGNIDYLRMREEASQVLKDGLLYALEDRDSYGRNMNDEEA